MNNELLIAKGRLADTEKQLEEANLKADNYMILIRELLDPYAKFEELELDKVIAIAKEFRDLQLRVRELTHLRLRIKSDFNL
jgi:acetyl-CoA carboxylase carboxyltransferase component